MRRRGLFALFAGAAAWPVAARAQHAVPVIGFIDSGSSDRYAPFVAAFRSGLEETGFVEGRNVAVEFRFAEGRYDQLRKHGYERPMRLMRTRDQTADACDASRLLRARHQRPCRRP
jgi:hypothetical protein